MDLLHEKMQAILSGVDYFKTSISEQKFSLDTDTMMHLVDGRSCYTV